MNNNKSPGPEGLQKEYYSTMWEEIKYDILSYIQGLDLHKELPQQLTTGAIKLLYKKGDPRLLKNWRPISLLNVDFKLITSLISRRLSKVLNKLIGPHQSCAIKGRYMIENSISIELLLQVNEFHYNKILDRQDDTIMSLDMEKAFDRVEHEYLFQILDKMNIGKHLINKIQLIYRNIHQQVETPWGYTDKIKIKRGIRQGCALSMTLFTIEEE